jgi:glucose-6-phosphate isomerase, archaeal
MNMRDHRRDLSISGLDMGWAIDGTLAFAPEVYVDEIATRPLSRLLPVALDPESCVPPERALYWMYNGIGPKAEQQRVRASGLRYELTLMLPDPIGRECAKTLGHYHAVYPKDQLGYPEIIEVQHGAGYFVFFDLDWRARRSTFAMATLARAGDKLVIPPNLFHGAVVVGDEPLLFADLLPEDINPVYGHIAHVGGMSHLYLTDGSWLPNPRYAEVGALQLCAAAEYPELGLTRDRPLYDLFLKEPQALQWLRQPERFAKTVPGLWDAVKAHVLEERIEHEYRLHK